MTSPSDAPQPPDASGEADGGANGNGTAGRYYGRGIPYLPIDAYPGKLIAIEGTDGVGRSTQIQLLREWLEVRGYGVIETGWTRSALMQPTIEIAKSSNTLNKLTFVLLYATDFADRLEKEIIPALKAGFVVLSDRYIFTALARAGVRGIERHRTDPLPGLVLRESVAREHGVPVGAVAVPRAPWLGVVMRTRVVLHEIEAVAARERDGRFGELRRALVLVREEVPPHREGNTVGRLAAERPRHSFARVHLAAANVTSSMPPRSSARRTRGSVSVASSMGRSRAYADVATRSASGSPGWHMSSLTPSSSDSRIATRAPTSM